MYRIIIDKGQNGYVMQAVDDESTYFAFEEVNDSEYNRDHFIKMLYQIAECFDEQGNKHDPVRLKIGYTKGEASDKEVTELGLIFGILETK